MFNRKPDQSKIINILLRKLGYSNDPDPVKSKLFSACMETISYKYSSRVHKFLDNESDLVNEVFMSDFSPGEVKLARYCALVDGLLKAFNQGQVNDCMDEMIRIRKELQRNTLEVLEQNKELLNESHAFTFVQAAKYGIENQPALNTVKRYLSETRPGSQLNQFLAKELGSLNNQDMVSDPKYALLIYKLSQTQDDKAIKFIMQEAEALRQKGQLAAKIYMSNKDNTLRTIDVLTPSISSR